eukprot:192801-Chlamydomonas_euryale.AAC.1
MPRHAAGTFLGATTRRRRRRRRSHHRHQQRSRCRPGCRRCPARGDAACTKCRGARGSNADHRLYDHHSCDHHATCMAGFGLSMHSAESPAPPARASPHCSTRSWGRNSANDAPPGPGAVWLSGVTQVLPHVPVHLLAPQAAGRTSLRPLLLEAPAA